MSRELQGKDSSKGEAGRRGHLTNGEATDEKAGSQAYIREPEGRQGAEHGLRPAAWRQGQPEGLPAEHHEVRAAELIGAER